MKSFVKNVYKLKCGPTILNTFIVKTYKNREQKNHKTNMIIYNLSQNYE